MDLSFYFLCCLSLESMFIILFFFKDLDLSKRLQGDHLYKMLQYRMWSSLVHPPLSFETGLDWEAQLIRLGYCVEAEKRLLPKGWWP